MEKIKIKLKECCLTCDNFDSMGIKGIGLSLSCCGEKDRVIACGHMEVCWKYNNINLQLQTKKKPVNVKKSGGDIFSAECPSCGYCFPDLGGAYEPNGEAEKFNFCPECGQKIDWGESNG